MGFLFHAIKVRIPRVLTPTFFFLRIWRLLKFFVIGALTHLGLHKPPPELHDSADNSNNYIFILDGTCPSPVPIPIHVVTAAIKRRVPVVRFELLQPRMKMLTMANHQQQLQDEGEEEEEEKQDIFIYGDNSENTCTICFEAIELKHEVRELCRCTHVFHRDCLDTWVDSGQVTCPLCRSMLLPPKTNLSRCTLDPPFPHQPPNPMVVDAAPSIAR